jgi:hypothetical protein
MRIPPQIDRRDRPMWRPGLWWWRGRQIVFG